MVANGVYLKGTAAEYKAKTEIDGGFLEIQSTGAAGSGLIAFEKGQLDVSPGAKLANSIGDFNANDTVELLGVVANKDSFSKDVLTLLDGNAVVSKLTFAGNYNPFDFHVRESHGDAIVTYSPSASQSASALTDFAHGPVPSSVHDPLDFASAAGSWR